MEVMEEQGKEEVWPRMWSMDWKMSKNKPDGGKRCRNIICIGAIACRGSSWSDRVWG